MSDQAALARTNTLYETDFVEWTQEQARLLRERRFDDLDLENLIDEVETVGRSNRYQVENRCEVLLAHLLKWAFQPGRRGSGWRRTIFEQRSRIARLVKDSPSLRGHLTEAVEITYGSAVLRAASETGIRITLFPTACPFTTDQVFDPHFFPENPAEE